MVFTSLPITLPTMTSIFNTTDNNNISTLSASNSAPTPSNFGVYQHTSIGLSEISIHTLVPDAISARSYIKVLITKIFFCYDLPLSDTSSVSFRKPMITVVSYFGSNTDSAKRESKADVQSLDINFIDISGKPIRVLDSVNCFTDIIYFTFRFGVSTTIVDRRPLKKYYLLNYHSTYIPSNSQFISENKFENNNMSIPEYSSYSTVISSSNSNYKIVNIKNGRNKNFNNCF